MNAQSTSSTDEAAAKAQNAPSHHSGDTTSELSETELHQFTFGEFFGSVEGWHRFSRRFQREVANDVMFGNEKKYQLLANACQQEAKFIIGAAEHDFERAWQLFEEMYGESYAQLNFCLNKILQTKRVDVATIEGLEYIQKRGDTCVDLQTQHDRQNDFNTMLVVYLADKIDDETGRAWDRHRMELARKWAAEAPIDSPRFAHHFMPEWKDFTEFIRGEIDILEKRALRLGARAAARGIAPKRQRAESQTPTMDMPQDVRLKPTSSIAATASSIQVRAPSVSQENQMTPSTSNAATSSVGQRNTPRLQSTVAPHSMTECKARAPVAYQCKLCTGIHLMFHCDVYRDMYFDDKWTFVKNNRLCPRCFYPMHPSTRCTVKNANKQCRFCWNVHRVVDYHNGTLCPTKFASIAFTPDKRSPAPPPQPQPDDDWDQPGVPTPGRYR